jgi:amidase
VEEARPDGIEETFDIILKLFFADGGTGVDRMLEKAGTTESHPFLNGFREMQRANALTGAEFGALLERWDAVRSRMLSFMEGYDAIVCPAGAFNALPHGVSLDDDKFPGFSYNSVYNVAGWPAAVVRGGTSADGLPIGVQIATRPWREDVALAVARRLEEKLGGFEPPTTVASG